MFDVAHEKPQPVEVDGKTKIEPIEQYGVKVLSIGFFADQDQAIVWRGPMASRALNQLFTDANWGALDFMIVDLPPGTGDIHLSLVQQIPLSGAVIVSTPQDVALADARKGVGMFRLEELKVPVLGMVETWPISCRTTCRTRSTTSLGGTASNAWRTASMRLSSENCPCFKPSARRATPVVLPHSKRAATRRPRFGPWSLTC